MIVKPDLFQMDNLCACIRFNMLSRIFLCTIVIYSVLISDVKGRSDKKVIEDDVYDILMKVIKSNGKLTRPVKERTPIEKSTIVRCQ